VPDQSQSFARSGSQNTGGNPADTSANDPQAASPESVASNVNRASEGEQAQAAQTISGDPTIATGGGSAVSDMQNAGQQQTEGDNYDDEDAWPYRSLQHEVKGRGLNAAGTREELVERLRSSDSSGSSGEVSDDVPRAAADSAVVENGGIRKTGFAQAHAEVLQGLSQERKQQQLAAASRRKDRSSED
jgi:hypothetical protein